MTPLTRTFLTVLLSLIAGLLVCQYIKVDRQSEERSSVGSGILPIERVRKGSFRLNSATLDQLNDSLAQFAETNHSETNWLIAQQLFSLPADRLSDALALLDAHRPFDEEQPIRALFSRWAEVDPKAALEALRSLPQPAMMAVARHEVIRAWAFLAPEEAIAYFEKEPGWRVVDLWHHFADASPEKAFTLTTNIKNTNLRRACEEAVIERIQRHDPLDAIDWLINNRGGKEEGRRKVGEVMSMWMRRDAEQALEKLRSLPEVYHSHQLYEDLGRAAKRPNDEVPIAFLEEIPEHFREAYIGGALFGMIEGHPDQVMTLVETLPEGRARQNVLAGLAARLAEVDVNKASRWLSNLEPALSRDLAIGALTRHLVHSDPEAAAIWASDIGDHDIREQSLRDVITSWRRKNPEAADEWIAMEHNGLSEDQE